MWSEVLFLIPRFANEAVTVFFVLSGYLVGGKTIERAIAGKFNGIAYAIDRATRIWLPLIPVVFFTWTVTALRGEKVNWAEGIGNIFALQCVTVKPLFNNTSLWSLSYEIWFYIAALGFGVLLSSKGRRICLPLVLIALVAAVFLQLRVCFLFVWIFGALSYFVRPARQRWWLLSGGLLLTTVGGLLSALAVEVKSIDIQWLLPLVPKRDFSQLLLGMGIALVIPVLVSLRPRRPWLAQVDRYGTSLAAWSYSLYLIHRPVLQLWSQWHGFRPFDRLNYEALAMYGVKIGSCLAMGFLFWLLFENQTDRLRRALKRGLVRVRTP